MLVMLIIIRIFYLLPSTPPKKTAGKHSVAAVQMEIIERKRIQQLTSVGFQRSAFLIKIEKLLSLHTKVS